MKITLINFGSFIKVLETKLEFEVKWDINQWNDAYWDFKNWCKGVDPEWAAFQTAQSIMEIFADDFYQDATKDTHEYWLKQSTQKQK